jgi:TP901 family phage tail tape measure protein
MSPEGQAKVSLILELKNRIKTGLTQAKENLNKNVSEMKSKLISLKNTHIQAFQAMKDQIPSFGNALSLLGNPYALLTAAILAFGAVGVKAANWSADFKRNMAEVNVTAQLSQTELDRLSTKLVTIGTRNVAPLEGIPQAFNRIISAGLDVNTSLKVLEPTLRAAKAGFTDLETVASAGVGVMASSGENITKVYDVLFATLNKGNAKFRDVAQYLPKIIPLAKGAGFALGETAGAWAFLTAQGQNPEQATTGIMNLLKMMTNLDTVKGLSGLGVHIYNSAGKIRPMVDIISQLGTKMNRLSDAGKGTFLDKAGITDMEAKGALLSMIQNVDKLKKITDFTTNSAGQLNEAYKNAYTGADAWKEMMNKIKGYVIKPIGDELSGLVAKTGEWLLGTINYFKELYNQSSVFRDYISYVGTILKVTFAVAFAPIKALYNIFMAFTSLFKDNSIGKGIESFYLRIKPIFLWLYDIVSQVSTILYKFITFDFKGAVQAVQSFKMPSLAQIESEQVKEMAERTRAKYKNNEDNPFSADAKVPGTDPNNPNNNPAGADSINAITGSAKQVRNIEVKIDSFVKGMSISNQNVQQMDNKQLEAFFSDMFLRVIRNMETSYQ